MRSLPFVIVTLMIIGGALAVVRTSHGLWHEDFQIAVSVETGEWNHTCVRSAGYWRTHSNCSTNPHRDPAWDRIGEETPFFDTQETWCSALWETEQKDPYWRLARQYIAARLNEVNGAERPPVLEAALNRASAWLEDHEPGNIGEDDPDYQQSVELKNLLEDFNTGQQGPTRCDDNERNDGDYIDHPRSDEGDATDQNEDEDDVESTESEVEDQPTATPEITPTETDDSSADDSSEDEDTPPTDDSTETDEDTNDPELTEEPDSEDSEEATPTPTEEATDAPPEPGAEDVPPVEGESGEGGD